MSLIQSPELELIVNLIESAVSINFFNCLISIKYVIIENIKFLLLNNKQLEKRKERERERK